MGLVQFLSTKPVSVHSGTEDRCGLVPSRAGRFNADHI